MESELEEFVESEVKDVMETRETIWRQVEQGGSKKFFKKYTFSGKFVIDSEI